MGKEWGKGQGRVDNGAKGQREKGVGKARRERKKLSGAPQIHDARAYSVQARRAVGPRVQRVGMVNKKCEHGRRRSICKECGGSAICEHGRQRHQCKECGGSDICKHGRQRRHCKDCGGKECGVWSYESTSMEDLVGYSCGVCKVREWCQPGGAGLIFSGGDEYRKTANLERASGFFEAKMLHFWAAGWGEIGQKKPL